jgi:sugar/nucleoside kinase (ribokinase family)
VEALANLMTEFGCDILGLGCTAVDDLVYVAAYPPADVKVPIRARDRQCGGLTATALVAAARLGSRCTYAGCLGDDELSRFVLDRLRAEGIDMSPVVRRKDARPVHAVIVVDETHHTRNIFYDLAGVIGADPRQPSADLIRAARVLFVDYIGMEGMLRAAAIAREASVPVVADIENDREPRFRELLALVDHLIVSVEFALRITGEPDPARAAAALWSADREAVVVTCGAEGAWYMEAGAAPCHQPAYRVKVVDTTGCGDVFHGAYASALARGLDLPARIRLAAATSALKATCPGGQAGIPSRDVVEAFLKSPG